MIRVKYNRHRDEEDVIEQLLHDLEVHGEGFQNELMKYYGGRLTFEEVENIVFKVRGSQKLLNLVEEIEKESTDREMLMNFIKYEIEEFKDYIEEKGRITPTYDRDGMLMNDPQDLLREWFCYKVGYSIETYIDSEEIYSKLPYYHQLLPHPKQPINNEQFKYIYLVLMSKIRKDEDPEEQKEDREINEEIEKVIEFETGRMVTGQGYQIIRAIENDLDTDIHLTRDFVQPRGIVDEVVIDVSYGYETDYEELFNLTKSYSERGETLGDLIGLDFGKSKVVIARYSGGRKYKVRRV